MGLVETADGDGDAIDCNAPICQRRAALTAVIASHRLRRAEGAGLPSGPNEVCTRDPGEGLKVIARCFLAHATPANAGVRRLGHKGVAERATLASTAPYGLAQIRHEHCPLAMKPEKNAGEGGLVQTVSAVLGRSRTRSRTHAGAPVGTVKMSSNLTELG